MRPARHARVCPSGFTLLEVMLVLLLMGLATSVVIFNGFSTDKTEQLEQQARRFQVLTDMASDYAVMNQQQLGIRIEPQANGYFFMALDEDNRWQQLEGVEVYAPRELPEAFSLILNLDDLPWDQDAQLFDREIFDEQFSLDDSDINVGAQEDKPLPPPQILIMSSGEITPFIVTFAYEPAFGNDNPAYFQLQNQDFPPVTLNGPLRELTP